ncbi:MAG: DUF1499 domain-containing protein [Gemmatimonadota bacterium]|nr:DUF1499 domain-containing protein [Gemmatimonadota bacterium]
MSPVRRSILERRAETHPGSDDRRLLGRTYAIPFEDVWQASTSLARDLRGWNVVSADDRAGRIDAIARSVVLGRETEVVISVGLDENAQTRVDLSAETRTRHRGDFGRSRRLIGRFTTKLDANLRAHERQILDPAALPRFQGSA